MRFDRRIRGPLACMSLEPDRFGAGPTCPGRTLYETQDHRAAAGRRRTDHGLERQLQAQQNAMTFFVTSAGPGKGADLGGWRARTAIARPWRRPPAPAIAPGAPISAPARRAALRP